MKNETALLIFARTASEECKHKTFKASKPFFQLQNTKVLSLAKSSKLDYFWINEHRQVGKTFQERYLNAIQSVFNKGYSKVISIGNDSPELELRHIDSAVQYLRFDKVCFGPSKDGGFYLWGIQKEAFCKEAFIGFSWKTNSVFTEIQNHFKHNSITVSCLETLADLDQREDAYYLLKSASLSDEILSILLLMLEDQEVESYLNDTSIELNHSKLFYNKGSPAAA
jgi:glycosyltransferase A (GT-A) superfamily protein (DUF2064 family)